MRALLLTLTTCLFILPAQAQYSGGSGTPDDPYQIATAADLIALGETPDDYDKHFILTADIDLDPNLPVREVFDKAVIAPDTEHALDRWGHDPYDGIAFTGDFDGSAHVISHLTIAGDGYLGLFGQLGRGAKISDLRLAAVEVNGTYICIGSIAGRNYDRSGRGGVLTNCHSTGRIKGHNCVGGLVGDNVGSITASCSSGTVTGNSYVGGLVGFNYLESCVSQCQSSGRIDGNDFVGGLLGGNWGVLTHSYSSATVTGSDYVGGLVGDCAPELSYRPDDVILSQCYSTGTVTGTGQYVGGLVGCAFEDTRPVQCFWDRQTSGQATSMGGTGLTTREMQTMYTFQVWAECDGQGIWTIDEGKDYPRLWWEQSPGEMIRTAQLSDSLSGTGMQNDPFLIYTPQELKMIALFPCTWDKHFKLMADIDLSGSCYYTALIAPDVDPSYDSYFEGTSFAGVFDGNGHIIQNFTVRGADFVGLFGKVDSEAEIYNLGIVNADVDGKSFVGALAGENGGHIMNCFADARISGGKICTIYSDDDCEGDYFVGGLIGFNGGCLINCYTTGTMHGGMVIGGLIGYNGGSVINCCSIARVRWGEGTGPLFGSNNGRVVACFWDAETSPREGCTGGEGLETAAMQDIQTFLCAGWDFVGETENGVHDVWRMPEEGGYPVLSVFHGYAPSKLPGQGTSEEPFLISAAIDMGWVYYHPTAHFRLMAEIDLSHMIWSYAVVPIFKGRFDGNGFTVKGLRVSGPTELGLFGKVVQGAWVRGLGVVDVNVVGSGGGLAGTNRGRIENCYSTGALSGQGGLLAGDNYGEVSDCHSTGTMTGSGGLLLGSNYNWVSNCHSAGTISGGENTGGLVGTNLDSIRRCHSSGTVSGTENVGGLVGFSRGPGGYWHSGVTDCYSTGEVSGSRGNVGGLIGRAQETVVSGCFSRAFVFGNCQVGGIIGEQYTGVIANCWSDGDVSGEHKVGGLVGSTGHFCTVENCYSAGKVVGQEDEGGLIGYDRILRTGASVISSFWDIEASGLAYSSAGTGLTTAEMQSATTFLETGWDFIDETENGTDDIWWILEGQDYPRLWWEVAVE